MFTFNRAGVNYEIKFLSQGDDDLLACIYEEAGQTKWRAVLDTYDLNHPTATYYNDEHKFLEVFLKNLNDSLDKAHSDGDSGSASPQERLVALIKGKLSFNGKHVVLG